MFIKWMVIAAGSTKEPSVFFRKGVIVGWEGIAIIKLSPQQQGHRPLTEKIAPRHFYFMAHTFKLLRKRANGDLYPAPKGIFSGYY